MEYRIHPSTGDRISVIGFGTGPLGEVNEQQAAQALHYAVDHGINYFDFATADAKTFAYAGKALSDRRKDLFYQIHFGADYSRGVYGWTTDADRIRKQIAWQLEQLQTDYIDFGFIHCLDEESDWKQYRENGALAFLLEMKEKGVVRHIGLSSHTPSLANRVLDLGIVEQLMFSINPGYDYHHGEFANGSADERMQLYCRCEAEKIGISVMKPFCAGQLLKAETSPFHQALSKSQCIQYALDKPGVITVLAGMKSTEEVREVLTWCDAAESEKDYSFLGSFTPGDASGTCVYCNHCAPCPAELNIGLINKYYDLARIGDPMAAEHYAKLYRHAEDCIGCGHCDRRCPFRVAQSTRMKEIAAWFSE